jgi:hypothetical protein
MVGDGDGDSAIVQAGRAGGHGHIIITSERFV